MALTAYTHTQSTAATIWTVVHNLNLSAPIVSVCVDINGTLEKIIPKDIRAVSSSVVEIEFTSARAGVARIV